MPKLLVHMPKLLLHMPKLLVHMPKLLLHMPRRLLYMPKLLHQMLRILKRFVDYGLDDTNVFIMNGGYRNETFRFTLTKLCLNLQLITYSIYNNVSFNA